MVIKNKIIPFIIGFVFFNSLFEKNLDNKEIKSCTRGLKTSFPEPYSNFKTNILITPIGRSLIVYNNSRDFNLLNYNFLKKKFVEMQLTATYKINTFPEAIKGVVNFKATKLYFRALNCDRVLDLGDFRVEIIATGLIFQKEICHGFYQEVRAEFADIL